MIVCAALSFAVWAIVEAPFQSFVRVPVDHLAGIRPDILTTAILIVFIAGCWPLGRGRWLAFLGLRRFWTYPPLWIAVAMALLGLAFRSGTEEAWHSFLDATASLWWSMTQVPVWLWITLVVVAVCIMVWTIFEHVTQRKKSRRPSNANGNGTNLESLIAWLRDDREIVHPDDNLFGHDEIARRIVDRLDKPGVESPSMAVVGALGSGKSTIRAFVEHGLASKPSVRMLTVSLWPFDTAEAAVAGILREVVRSLGAEVNTLAVTGLSERYTTTIERAAGRWGVLAPYLRGESRPEAILEQVTSIATAAGVKLVLWIEDMERFSGTDRRSPEDAAIREAERLGPIQSLLHLLDRCDSVTVIIADISLRSRLDVGKIARFVESPPRPKTAEVWRDIATLRSGCLAKEFIDPASAKYRQKLTLAGEFTYLDRLQSLGFGDEISIRRAIVLLLDTPRSFKWALRITYETWEKLCGEIDFDSVLIASALRVARPDVFALIDEHIDLFRHGFRDPLSSGQGGQTMHPVLEQLDGLLMKEETDRMRNAVKVVIAFVFPAALRNYKSDNEYVACPQGLSVTGHVDYWQRYLSLPDVAAEDSDQAALKNISAWKSGGDNDLVARLIDPNRSAQIETFVGQFTVGELCRLLGDTTRALHHASAATWEEGRHAPGITSVWRMMHRQRPPVAQLGEVVATLVRDLVTHHLPLANDIYYFFAHDEHSRVPSLLDQEQRDMVRQTLREGLVAKYDAGAGEELLNALHEGSPRVVYFLCQMASSAEPPDLPFDGWEGVSSALLAAAEQNPNVGVVLTVSFFTTSQLVTTHQPAEGTGIPQQVRDFVAEADLEAARRLFDFDRLAPLLANTNLPEGFDRQMRVQYEAAQVIAKEV